MLFLQIQRIETPENEVKNKFDAIARNNKFSKHKNSRQTEK
jgi:hypothetical protein